MKKTKKQRRLQKQKKEMLYGLITGIVGLFLGVLFAGLGSYYPIATREEAVAYTGVLASIDEGENYFDLCFADGACHSLYPHTVGAELRDALASLPEGAVLHLLINPHTDYAAEIRTDAALLLDFEASQAEVDRYNNCYIWIGGFVSLCGLVMLIASPIAYKSCQRGEKKRQMLRKSANDTEDSPVLRYADPDKKCRVFLEIQQDGLHICYRRVGRVNELVINGRVYDEYKALLEFSHALTARVGGHFVEAGFDGDQQSYILLDGVQIAEKTRLF